MEPREYAVADTPGSTGLGRAADSGWLWGLGERLTWLAATLLSLSTLMGWYVDTNAGSTTAVIGWHTGLVGKLVFVVGLLVLALVLLSEAGIALPATVPESLVVIVLGSIATVLVLVRLISIPDEFFPYGRGVGIWISLVAAIGVIAAGLLRASDEL